MLQESGKGWQMGKIPDKSPLTSDKSQPQEWLSDKKESKWDGREYYKLIVNETGKEKIQYIKEGNTNIGEAIVFKVKNLLSKIFENQSPPQIKERVVKEYKKEFNEEKGVIFQDEKGKSNIEVNIQDDIQNNRYEIQSGKNTFILIRPKALQGPLRSPDVEGKLFSLKMKRIHTYHDLNNEILQLKEKRGVNQSDLRRLEKARDQMGKLESDIAKLDTITDIQWYDSYIDNYMKNLRAEISTESVDLTEEEKQISQQRENLNEDIESLSKEITAVKQALKEKRLSPDPERKTAISISDLEGLLMKIDIVKQDAEIDAEIEKRTPSIIQVNQFLLDSFRQQFEVIKHKLFPIEVKVTKFSNEMDEFINKWNERKELNDLQKDALHHIALLRAQFHSEDLKRKETGIFTEFSEKRLNEIKNEFETLQLLFEKSSSQKLEMSSEKFQQEATALETKLKEFELTLNKDDDFNKSTLEKLNTLKTHIQQLTTSKTDREVSQIDIATLEVYKKNLNDMIDKYQMTNRLRKRRGIA